MRTNARKMKGMSSNKRRCDYCGTEVGGVMVEGGEVIYDCPAHGQIFEEETQVEYE
jgi:hypothetical protein